MTQDALKSVFLFETLDSEALKNVSSFSSSRTLEVGELIFSEGDSADAFFVVLSGQVEIYKLSPRGEKQILHIHGPTDLVAEAAIFDRTMYPAHCEALEETEVLRIDKAKFLNWIRSHPEIALKLLTSYSRRLREFVKLIADLTFRDARERLANYLLENSRTDGGEVVCRLPVSKKELAAILGTVPETLSRALRELKGSGAIEEKDKDIKILDAASLRTRLET